MTLYCIDSSVLIQANAQLAPMDLNPTFWEKLEALIATGRVISPDEVLREIEKKSDDVHEWCKRVNKNATSFFVELEEKVQTATSEILASHPKLVDDRQGKGQADPFVIALARVRGASVVTQEGRTGSSARPKIPDVCDHYGVPCMDLLDLMRRERWRF